MKQSSADMELAHLCQKVKAADKSIFRAAIRIRIRQVPDGDNHTLQAISIQTKPPCKACSLAEMQA